MSALHHKVREGIMNRIAAGDLKVGDRLPPEADYAAELGVSRATLRRAFADLERAKILERRKRAGTRIIATQPLPSFSMETGGLNTVLSIDAEAIFAITATRNLPAEAIPGAKEYGVASDIWLEITGARRMPDETTPFSINRVYVPPRYAGVEAMLGGLDTSIFRAMEAAFGVTVGRVCQSVRARTCPVEDALAMGLASNAPVLEIEAQLYTRDGDLLEISLATFDAARFEVKTDVDIG